MTSRPAVSRDPRAPQAGRRDALQWWSTRIVVEVNLCAAQQSSEVVRFACPEKAGRQLRAFQTGLRAWTRSPSRAALRKAAHCIAGWRWNARPSPGSYARGSASLRSRSSTYSSSHFMRNRRTASRHRYNATPAFSSPKTSGAPWASSPKNPRSVWNSWAIRKSYASKMDVPSAPSVARNSRSRSKQGTVSASRNNVSSNGDASIARMPAIRPSTPLRTFSVHPPASRFHFRLTAGGATTPSAAREDASTTEQAHVARRSAFARSAQYRIVSSSTKKRTRASLPS
mmetsp:Transcript_13232/g.38402  ORF Transcript_13232/g.38402 Transcript_13232/m.38402 type:complete len:285 (-) Transcript_13232:1164-2018(-)